MDEKKYQAMLAVVKTYHAGQTREGGVKPYWPHCERVGLLLRRALETSGEGSEEEQENLVLAGLGHDLYEDTKILPQEIRENFGEKVDGLIAEDTNRFGDGQVALYAEKLKSVSELALLIKFADLCDNYGTGGSAVSENGYEWTKDFLWPILETQWEVVKDLSFVQFPKTADFLKQAVAVNREILEKVLLQDQEKTA